jgi:hypothetical protein
MNSIDGSVLHESAQRESVWRAIAHNRVRLLKSAVGALLLGMGAWYGYAELVLTRSVDATVSCEFSAISAPIDGYIQLKVRGKGETIGTKSSLLAIENPLVDRSAVIELETKLATLDGEIASATEVIARLRGLSTEFEARGRSYLRQRSQQLEVAIDQSRARLDVQQARLAAAQTQLLRVEDMAKEGVASTQQVDEARKDAAIADGMVADATMTVALQRASLKASKDGVTIGDYSSTDRSYSNQRADEVALNLAQVGAQLAEKQARRVALTTGLAELVQQLNLRRHSELAAPTRSRVWSLLAGDKQWVSRGQNLLRVMDCSHMQVLAYLSRRKFDSVRVGQSVQIELNADGRKFMGKVVLTMGKHPSPERLEPLAPTENYAVLVESQQLTDALREACDTGQRAEVTFLRGS